MDKPKAVTAAAHKLARLIYSLLITGEQYTDQWQAYYKVALSAAGAAQPQQAGAAVGHDSGINRAGGASGMKRSLCVSHLRGLS
jgi:hypothetical protein